MSDACSSERLCPNWDVWGDIGGEPAYVEICYGPEKVALGGADGKEEGGVAGDTQSEQVARGHSNVAPRQPERFKNSISRSDNRPQDVSDLLSKANGSVRRRKLRMLSQDVEEEVVQCKEEQPQVEVVPPPPLPSAQRVKPTSKKNKMKQKNLEQNVENCSMLCKNKMTLDCENLVCGMHCKLGYEHGLPGYRWCFRHFASEWALWLDSQPRRLRAPRNQFVAIE